MELPYETEADSLSRLEEQVRKAADIVTRLRRERDAAIAEKEAALRQAAEVRTQLDAAAQELETLRSERKQVRSRIEKLLGQTELWSAE